MTPAQLSVHRIGPTVSRLGTSLKNSKYRHDDCTYALGLIGPNIILALPNASRSGFCDVSNPSLLPRTGHHTRPASLTSSTVLRSCACGPLARLCKPP